jgi:hypothetical protein
MSDFYAATGGACFALLGLWWVVIQLNADSWLRDPDLRRMAGRTSLYFLLPGTMSILSLLDVTSAVYWRGVFLSGAAVGLVEAVLAVRAARSRTAGQPAPLLVASFVIYIVIAVVALSPTLIRRMGATPLMVEGILLAGLILLGAALAWTQLVASAERSAAGR